MAARQSGAPAKIARLRAAFADRLARHSAASAAALWSIHIMRIHRHTLSLIAALVVAPIVAAQQPVKASTAAEALASTPNLTTLINVTSSEMAPVIDRYSADLASLNRRYDAGDSPDQRRRMRDFYMSWRTRLAEMPFDKLKQEGRVDYVLLDNRLTYQLALLDRADKERQESADLLPFADRLLALHDRRR